MALNGGITEYLAGYAGLAIFELQTPALGMSYGGAACFSNIDAWQGDTYQNAGQRCGRLVYAVLLLFAMRILQSTA